MSEIIQRADQLIGGTPLLELKRIVQEERLRCRLLAKLAGMPAKVVKRAREILAELEEKGPSRIIVPVQVPPRSIKAVEDALPMGQLALADPVTEEIRQRIEALSVETMTPIEALNALYELKQLL